MISDDYKIILFENKHYKRNYHEDIVDHISLYHIKSELS